MNRNVRKSFGLRTPLLVMVAAMWTGCGGGGSEEERWGVDPVDSGMTSESDSQGGKDDKGSAGRKSAAGGKAGSGAAGENAASGGKGGDKANGGSGGKAGAGGKGGSGGKGGAGGRASAGKAGAGGSDNMSGGTALSSAACLACEKLNPDGACKDRRAVCPAFGASKAMGGPKAGGLKTDLCDELEACVSKTRCALLPGAPLPMSVDEVYPHRCWCGDEDVDSCISNAMPQGPCAAEIVNASESAMGPDIAQRLVDPGYAVGAVFSTVTCDAIRCAKSCGLCDPNDPACVDTDAAMGGETGMDAGM